MYAYLIPARTTIKYIEQYEDMIKAIQPSLQSSWATSSGTWCVFSVELNPTEVNALISADSTYSDPTGGDYIISSRTEIVYSGAYDAWMKKKSEPLGISYNGLVDVGGEKRLYFSRPLSTSEVSTLESIEQSYFDADVEADMDFGKRLLVDFANENIQLGISTDSMTKTVRVAMKEVSDALFVGALLDAIDEARLIPGASKDAKYITDVRLLEFINKIETHYSMSLSTTV